jgi:hypothetical protein
MVARKGKLEGVIDGQGKTLLPFEFSKIEKFEFPILQQKKPGPRDFRWLMVSKNGFFGFLDSSGQEVVPPVWESVQWHMSDTLLALSKKGLQRLIDPRAETVFETHYEAWAPDAVAPMQFQKFMIAVQDGKKGLVDRQHRVLIPFNYEQVDWVEGNFACVQDKKGRKGLLRLLDRQILPFAYSQILKMDSNGLFAVKNHDSGLYGMVDSSGAQVLPEQFADCRTLNAGPFLAVRQPGGLMAVFDFKGKQLTEYSYQNLKWYPAAPDLILAQLEDKYWHFVNSIGKSHTVELYEALSLSQTVFTARIAEQYALIGLDGRRLTEFKYSAASGFSSESEQQQLARKIQLPEGRLLLGKARDAAWQLYVIDTEGREYRVKQ